MMKYGEAGMKKNLGIPIISSWLEEAMEQEHRTEYRAPSPIITSPIITIISRPLLFLLFGWGSLN